jgi:hypothetical protein
MATGYFGSTGNAEALLGMLIQAGARLRMGTHELWGSLETTSPAYTAYNASVGLQAGEAIDFGKVSDLAINIGATVSPFDAVNERQPEIYIVTEEVCEVSVGMTQFDPNILSVLVTHGVTRKLASPVEYLITFGGSCNITKRPLQLDVTNIACQLPASQDADLGITGIIFTVYNALATSGLNWSGISAKNLNTMSATFQGLPVTSLALGNQTGNVVIF